MKREAFGDLRSGVRFWMWLSIVVHSVDSAAFLAWPGTPDSGGYTFAIDAVPAQVFGVLWLLLVVGAFLVIMGLTRPLQAVVIRVILVVQLLTVGFISVSLLVESFGSNHLLIAGTTKWGCFAVAAGWYLLHSFYVDPGEAKLRQSHLEDNR